MKFLIRTSHRSVDGGGTYRAPGRRIWDRHQWRLWVPIVILGMGYVIGAMAKEPALPRIGQAPDFSLTTQEHAKLTLRELLGKVVVVTFIFTKCTDTCPVLTAKLVGVQRKIGGIGHADVVFIAITLTPNHDTPEVLKRYALAHGADLSRWSFLTGEEKTIHALANRYGVFVKKARHENDVDHGFLTSLIDRSGTIRVQYLGTRFDPTEMLSDLRALTREVAAQ